MLIHVRQATMVLSSSIGSYAQTLNEIRLLFPHCIRMWSKSVWVDLQKERPSKSGNIQRCFTHDGPPCASHDRGCYCCVVISELSHARTIGKLKVGGGGWYFVEVGGKGKSVLFCWCWWWVDEVDGWMRCLDRIDWRSKIGDCLILNPPWDILFKFELNLN